MKFIKVREERFTNKSILHYAQYSCSKLFVVPRAGVEPARPKALVFETNASTNSATWASDVLT